MLEADAGDIVHQDADLGVAPGLDRGVHQDLEENVPLGMAAADLVQVATDRPHQVYRPAIVALLVRRHSLNHRHTKRLGHCADHALRCALALHAGGQLLNRVIAAGRGERHGVVGAAERIGVVGDAPGANLGNRVPALAYINPAQF